MADVTTVPQSATLAELLKAYYKANTAYTQAIGAKEMQENTQAGVEVFETETNEAQAEPDIDIDGPRRAKDGAFASLRAKVQQMGLTNALTELDASAANRQSHPNVATGHWQAFEAIIAPYTA